MNRHTLTILVTLLTVTGAGANQLEEAIEDATKKCMFIGAHSLEHCGWGVTGRSADHSAARTAVKVAFEMRAAFMAACERRT